MTTARVTDERGSRRFAGKSLDRQSVETSTAAFYRDTAIERCPAAKPRCAVGRVTVERDWRPDLPVWARRTETKLSVPIRRERSTARTLGSRFERIRYRSIRYTIWERFGVRRSGPVVPCAGRPSEHAQWFSSDQTAVKAGTRGEKRPSRTRSGRRACPTSHSAGEFRADRRFLRRRRHTVTPRRVTQEHRSVGGTSGHRPRLSPPFTETSPACRRSDSVETSPECSSLLRLSTPHYDAIPRGRDRHL